MNSSEPVSGFNILQHPLLPSDALYEVHGYLSLEDMPSYILAMGKTVGQQLPLYSTDSGVVTGLSVRGILNQRYLQPKFQVKKLPSGEYSVEKISQHEPIAASFHVAFNIFEKALKSGNVDLIGDSFDALRQVTTLTVAEKRQLIDFILKNTYRIPISPARISAYLTNTNALAAATPQQLSQLLKLATQQANNWRAPSRHLLNSLIATLRTTIGDDAATRFNEIHPGVLAATLIDLLNNPDSLEGYRSLIAAIPAQVLEHLNLADIQKIISNVSIHSQKTTDDLSSFAQLFNSNEVQTEISGMENLEALVVTIIGTKNPALFRAFCSAVASQGRFSDIRRQIQLSIDCASIYNYDGAYLALLQTALQNQGQFGPAE